MQLWQIFGDGPLDLAASRWPSDPWYLAGGNYAAQADDGPYDRPHRSTSNQGTSAWPGSPYRHADLAALPESPTRVAVGAWWYGTIWGNGHVMLAIADETEAAIAVGVTNQNQVRVRYLPERGETSGQEELALSAGGATDDDVWTFYELVIERENGSLTFEVYLDDVLLLDDTIDDPFVGDLLCAGLNAARGAGSGGGSSQFHGGYVADTRLGPTLVAESRPAVQGAHDEWSPAGAVDRVNNDTPSGDVIEGMAGERTSYELDPFDLIGGTVIGVQVDVSYSASGAVPRLLMHHDGDDADGPTLPLAGGSPRLRFTKPFGLNPFTGNAFTADDLNATEFGLTAIDPEE